MRPRPAFTLLELLIVMILILMIMALGAPWLKRIQVRSELKSTAQNLQSELYATRLTAMKAGEAYLFRYQSQTGVYEILPKKVYDALNPEPPTSEPPGSQSTRSVGIPIRQNTTAQGVQTPGGEQTATHAYRKRLPNRFTFGTAKPALKRNTNETLTPDATRTVGSVSTSPLLSSPLFAEPEPPVWSEPIVFFPNGRTSNGFLELLTIGNHRFQIELTLRGLTGTARLGDITVLDQVGN